jgi:hypothetical protein
MVRGCHVVCHVWSGRVPRGQYDPIFEEASGGERNIGLIVNDGSTDRCLHGIRVLALPAKCPPLARMLWLNSIDLRIVAEG